MRIRVNRTFHNAQVAIGRRKPSHPEFDEREVPRRVGSCKFELIRVDVRECLMREVSRSRKLALKGEAVCDRKHHAGTALGSSTLVERGVRLPRRASRRIHRRSASVSERPHRSGRRLVPLTFDSPVLPALQAGCRQRAVHRIWLRARARTTLRRGHSRPLLLRDQPRKRSPIPRKGPAGRWRLLPPRPHAIAADETPQT